MAATSELQAVRQGEGSPVVLVHGFTQTSQSWQPITDELARDHRVVTVDAPGHGRSAEVHVDLEDGARLLGQAGGVASYIGYSMGGRLCLHLALREPSLVRALVLLGATAGLDDATERVARRDADEALARGLEADGLDAFLERWLAQPLFAHLSSAATGLEARRQNTVAGLASSLRLAGTGTQDPPLWDRLAELAMPVLVVAGEHDLKFRTIGDRLTASIGSNARMETIAGAGHAAHIEKPGPFLDIVRPFLDAHR